VRNEDAAREEIAFIRVHLRKLEDTGYVSVQKRFLAPRPQTRYALTERGRKALLAYLAHQTHQTHQTHETHQDP
jgi:predicted ArsR family transcriptional regulator